MIRFTPVVDAETETLVCDIHDGRWLIGTLELQRVSGRHGPQVVLRLLTAWPEENLQLVFLRGLDPDERETVE